MQTPYRYGHTHTVFSVMHTFQFRMKKKIRLRKKLLTIIKVYSFPAPVFILFLHFESFWGLDFGTVADLFAIPEGLFLSFGFDRGLWPSFDFHWGLCSCFGFDSHLFPFFRFELLSGVEKRTVGRRTLGMLMDLINLKRSERVVKRMGPMTPMAEAMPPMIKMTDLIMKGVVLMTEPIIPPAALMRLVVELLIAERIAS